jgi:hypothetical protein
MPVTETFDPLFAVQRQYSLVADPIPTSNVIESFKSTLVDAGWTLNQGYSATGTFVFPLGAPIAGGTGSGGTNIANCMSNPPILEINNINFSFYDPSSQTPVPNASCVMVPAATTEGVSLARLANSITANSVYIGTASGPDISGVYSVIINAAVPGSLANYPQIAANGRWIEGPPTVAGGGYELTSQGVTASQFSVTLLGVPNAGTTDGLLSFTFQFGGFGSAGFELDGFANNPPAIGPYSILATENQFIIWDPSSLTDYTSRSSSLFACAPLNKSSASYAAFVIGPQELRVETTWDNTNYGKIVALDGSVNSISNSQAYPRTMFLYNCAGTTPLLSPQGSPVVMGVYIGYGKSQDDPPALVGQIWDAILMSDIVTDGIYVDGFLYKIVSQWDGSGGNIRTSLLFRYQ